MITNFLIYFLTVLFGGLIDLVPTTPTLPIEWLDTITLMVSELVKWDSFFPILTMLAVFGTIVTIEAVLLGFRLAVFVFDKIRGSG